MKHIYYTAILKTMVSLWHNAYKLTDLQSILSPVFSVKDKLR